MTRRLQALTIKASNNPLSMPLLDWKYVILLFAITNLFSCGPKINKESQNIVAPEAYSLSGDSLYPLELPPGTAEKFKSEWEKAYQNYRLDSKKIDNIIWYGRRTAYLQGYQEAIKIYTEGLEIYPDSIRLLRHRGHRYISIRKFDLAAKDLSKAASLLTDTVPRTEADGLPNKLNIPLGNTQFNIYYHLGLAHYLKGEYDQAVSAYQRCLEYSTNDDLLVAILDWMYMGLRRAEQEQQATELLEMVHADMNIVENDSYHQRLLMYKGLRESDSLLQVSAEAEDRTLVLATQGYGVGNWYLSQGDTAQALGIFRKVIETGNWPAFGYIAAEADLFRLESK